MLKQTKLIQKYLRLWKNVTGWKCQDCPETGRTRKQKMEIMVSGRHASEVMRAFFGAHWKRRKEMGIEDEEKNHM